jgi:hypothetical protein
LEPPTTSKGLYDAASLRHELAGAALAAARQDLARARERLEAAEDDWMASAEQLRAHESKPGIPLYLSLEQQQRKQTYDRAGGHG